MSATLLLVEADLVFGVPTIDDIVLQNLDMTRDAKTAIATGEEGDEIGVSIYGGKVAEVKGDYLFIGSDINAIGDTMSADIGTALGIDDDIVCYGFGRKLAHEGFQTGDFRGISLTGGS